MTKYQIFFDGIADVSAMSPEEARRTLLKNLQNVPGLVNVDVGTATRVFWQEGEA